MYNVLEFVSTSVFSGGACGTNGVFSLRRRTFDLLLFEGHLEVSLGHFIFGVVVCLLCFITFLCFLYFDVILMVRIGLIAIVLSISMLLHVNRQFLMIGMTYCQRFCFFFRFVVMFWFVLCQTDML